MFGTPITCWRYCYESGPRDRSLGQKNGSADLRSYFLDSVLPFSEYVAFFVGDWVACKDRVVSGVCGSYATILLTC